MRDERRGTVHGCWHLTFATKGRQVPFPDETRRRLAIHQLVAVAGDELVLFCLVDDHFHVVVLCTRRRAGIIARALARTLAPIAVAPLRLGDNRPVETRSHVTWLVRYLLEQVLHHKIQGTHPALWTGSCFQDLVGARVIGGCRLRLWDVLPRLPLSTVCRYVQLSPDEIAPIGDQRLRAAGVARLAAAASAALAVPPDLRGKEPAVMLGKRAVSQLSRAAGIPRTEVAWALGVTVRTVTRLFDPLVEPAVMRAVRIRLTLEDVVRSRHQHTDARHVDTDE